MWAAVRWNRGPESNCVVSLMCELNRLATPLNLLLISAEYDICKPNYSVTMTCPSSCSQTVLPRTGSWSGRM